LLALQKTRSPSSDVTDIATPSMSVHNAAGATYGWPAGHGDCFSSSPSSHWDCMPPVPHVSKGCAASSAYGLCVGFLGPVGWPPKQALPCARVRSSKALISSSKSRSLSAWAGVLADAGPAEGTGAGLAYRKSSSVVCCAAAEVHCELRLSRGWDVAAGRSVLQAASSSSPSPSVAAVVLMRFASEPASTHCCQGRAHHYLIPAQRRFGTPLPGPCKHTPLSRLRDTRCHTEPYISPTGGIRFLCGVLVQPLSVAGATCEQRSSNFASRTITVYRARHFLFDGFQCPYQTTLLPSPAIRRCPFVSCELFSHATSLVVRRRQSRRPSIPLAFTILT
jgi:hypothetical protein